MSTERAGEGLKPGKVPPEVLARLLAIPRESCEDVLVAPAPGEDAAVLRSHAGRMVVTSDPITFPTPRPGHFAVCVNANDIAAMGGRPRFFTMTLMMPPGSSSEAILSIVQDAIESGSRQGIILIGGHTEVTAAVQWPVVSVAMLGDLVSPEPLRTGGACPGDALLQIGCLALEGTAILAAEHGERLTAVLGADLVRQALGRLEDPGISVVGPALRLAASDGVHALHDPTEGGLATGLREMAESAGLGVRVDAGRLLRLPETEPICRVVGMDPLGLIASGCLLAAVTAEAASALAADLRSCGYAAAVVGHFTSDPGLILCEEGGERPLPRFGVDELARS